MKVLSEKWSVVLLAVAALLVSGCSLTLELSECSADDDCSAGSVCTEDSLCIEEDISEPECEHTSDCSDGEICDEEGRCVDEPEPDPDCTEDDQCLEGEICDQVEGVCVEDEDFCADDDECADGLICEDNGCVEGLRCQDLGSYVESMWSDFEDSELTNVEGFREPRDSRTTATDLEGEGIDEGTVVRIDYDLGGDTNPTGYRLYAFPSADVGEFTHLVMRVRADDDQSLEVRLQDVDAIENGDAGSRYTLDVGRQWREVVVAVDDFERAESLGPVDTSELQLIELLFDGNQSVRSGSLYIDYVGFNRHPEAGGHDLVWSDFETDGLTNVEGFREPINENTEVTDLAHAGEDSGTVVQLDFELDFEEDGVEVTGYRLYAFPNADVSAYSHVVMRIRADRELVNATVEFYDDLDDQGFAQTNVKITEEWQEVVISLNQLELPQEDATAPDFSSLQLINLLFRDQLVCPAAATVFIDWVQFR